EGLGHELRGLTTFRTNSDRIGLFRVVGAAGSVRHLRLVQSVISGRNSVGALVGRNHGLVERSHVQGDTDGKGFDVGGLVGWSDGQIVFSRAEGTVSGDSYSVGGV